VRGVGKRQCFRLMMNHTYTGPRVAFYYYCLGGKASLCHRKHPGAQIMYPVSCGQVFGSREGYMAEQISRIPTTRGANPPKHPISSSWIHDHETRVGSFPRSISLGISNKGVVACKIFLESDRAGLNWN